MLGILTKLSADKPRARFQFSLLVIENSGQRRKGYLFQPALFPVGFGEEANLSVSL